MIKKTSFLSPYNEATVCSGVSVNLIKHAGKVSTPHLTVCYISN